MTVLPILDPGLVALVLVAVLVSFVVSSSAGLGGSLVLVPTLVVVMGPREGIALAALLLAANNVVKVVAYRATLPVARSLVVVVATMGGVALGARLLVTLPETVVVLAVAASLVVAFAAERRGWRPDPRIGPAVLAAASGATSGVSGTSGPLKGVALRHLGLDRRHTVGAASLVSLAGDLVKTGVFAEASLLGADAVRLAVACVPLMLVGTLLGRRLNGTVGERGYAGLFWTVTGGYALRLLLLA